MHCTFNSCSYQQSHVGANELASQNEKGQTTHEWRAELRKAVESYGTRPTSFALKFRDGQMLNATTRKNA